MYIVDENNKKKLIPGTKNIVKKSIRFSNCKMERGKACAWQMRDYMHDSGVIINLSEIPLCIPSGPLKTKKDEDGNTVTYADGIRVNLGIDGKPKLWGGSLNFSHGSSREVKLDSITHYLVIQALRDWKDTASSQKSEGLPEKKNGAWLVEYEPDVTEQMEYSDSMKITDALMILRSFYDDTDHKENFAYISHLMGSYGKRKKKYADLAKKLSSNITLTSKFLSFLQQNEEGEYVAKILDGKADEAAIKLALFYKVIEAKGGTHYFNGHNLGYRTDKILTEHQDKIAEIKHELLEVLNKEK